MSPTMQRLVRHHPFDWIAIACLFPIMVGSILILRLVRRAMMRTLASHNHEALAQPHALTIEDVTKEKLLEFEVWLTENHVVIRPVGMSFPTLRDLVSTMDGVRDEWNRLERSARGILPGWLSLRSLPSAHVAFAVEEADMLLFKMRWQE